MAIVLCYHHVREHPVAHATTPALFEMHLQAVRRAGLNFVDHDTFERAAHGQAVPDRRAVLLTTDDGHADNWYRAFPILEAHRVPAVFFVITDEVAEGPPRARHGEAGALEPPVGDRVRWSELAAMQRSGLVSVQSHTASHADRRDEMARGIADGPTLRADLARSRAAIAERLGRVPESLAWPWGFSNRAMRAAATDAGFGLQFSVVPGRNGRGTRRDFLYRCCVDGMPLERFEALLRALSQPVLGRSYSTLRFAWNRARHLRFGY